jgi:hypothetical protein
MNGSQGGFPEVGMSRRAAVQDCVFLACIIGLSCLPYVGGLGFYSDDWAFVAGLHSAAGSLPGMWDVLASMGLATRPVQGVVLIALYSLFELEVLGYHIVNAAALVSATILFHLSLRALGFARVVAVAVPLIFGLLPHYSTDRFWIAAFQANVSVLGTAALVGSVLAYEVTGPLFLVSVLVLWYAAGAVPGQNRVPRTAPALAVASNVLFLALSIGYKLTTTARADVGGGYRYRALRILTEAVPVHFGELGIGLPLRVVQVLRDHADVTDIVVSLLIGLIVCAYLLSVVRPSAPRLASRVSWPRVALIGGVLFCAGYGVSLMTWEIGFHSTGANNRTAIGAAIGVSWVFAGAIGWISSLLRTERLRWITFAALAGLLSASNTLIINAVADFWTRASQEQHAVIASIRERLPELTPGTALLLDGLCPFQGPGVVFATNWDVSGMLHLYYGDRSLQGDVVKPNTEVTAGGIRTLLFDDVPNAYPYGERLVVHHLRTGEAFVLTGEEAARQYFENVSIPSRPPCPPYTDGDGASIF